MTCTTSGHVMLLLSVLICILLCMTVSSLDYWDQRKQFIDEERNRYLGSDLELNSKEQQVNRMLMRAKRREYSSGLRYPETFPPAQHFFKAKIRIESSPVFAFIKDMPKGAVLHAHDTGLVSTDYLIFNLTYRDNLYACEDHGLLKFHFFENPDATCEWKNVQTMRTEEKDIDEYFRKRLSLVTDHPQDLMGPKVTLITENMDNVDIVIIYDTEKYPDINKVWGKFQQLFSTVSGLVNYRPVFEDYYYETLREFLNDGITYLEMRGILPQVYELDGSVLSPVDVIMIYNNVTKRFKQDHPNFYGAKIIYAPSRRANTTVAEEYMKNVISFSEMFPDLFAGFDLVGQEDKGRPLRDFVENILTLPKDIKFFFHAGETNWGGRTDMNLIDAVLLNTTRIGHGYALLKHPLVLKHVKDKDIGIEVNPVSNQVLGLVKDLRNHPAAAFLADNYPVIISCDDSGWWGALPLSHDLYETFMGLADAHADLRLLKQLILNSFKYSVLNPKEKKQAIYMWEQEWDKYINSVLKKNNLVTKS